MEHDHEKEREEFKEVCERLQRIHHAKRAYGNSWRKRGELTSVFGNVARKFDRLENLARDPEKWLAAIKGETNEPVEDTIIDLAVYSILWCVFVKEQRSMAFETAVKNAIGGDDG